MSDLPSRIDVPAAWYGPAMARTPDAWCWTLADDEVAELRTAARPFLTGGTPIAAVTPETFELPRLAERLRDLRRTLIDGIGFELIRGLPVEALSIEEVAIIFCGLGSHIGHMRSQNADGHLLGHVRDLGLDVRDPKTRIYQTRARQTFHTDSSDAVGLLCIRDAMEGGDSLLASSVTIYNEMQARRPDLVPELFEPVATDRRGEVPPGQRPYFAIPVYSWFGNRLTSIYQRQYIDSAQRLEDAPRLTERKTAALDLYDEIANDPAIHLSMRLAPGDLQFVYNHHLLHDRTGFRDWPDPDRRRHLLRLWLSLPGDRPLPPVFAERYGSVTVGDRGGIIVDGTALKVPFTQG